MVSFKNHSGFDGIMLSLPDAEYHLEFTHEHGATIEKPISRDNLIVFYIPDREQCKTTTNRMISFGYHPVKSHYPYWDKNGVTFEDPDGFNVVIQNTAWQP
jgi:hypothetical protein